MTFDLSIITNNVSLFLLGGWMTLKLAAVAVVAGMAIGSVTAAASLSGSRILRGMVMVYIALMRGIPFIVLIFLIHYGVPALLKIRSPALASGIVSLALFAGAYYTEVIRACVKALPAGQWESARAIGMSRWMAARHIIVPQILAPMLPPVVNVTVTMIKESSVLSSITIMELTMQGLVVQGETFAPFEVFVAVAIVYWAICGIFSGLARLAERRLKRDGGGRHMTPIVARYLILDGRRQK